MCICSSTGVIDTKDISVVASSVHVLNTGNYDLWHKAGTKGEVLFPTRIQYIRPETKFPSFTKNTFH